MDDPQLRRRRIERHSGGELAGIAISLATHANCHRAAACNVDPLDFAAARYAKQDVAGHFSPSGC
jgi:hypothetical protein